MADALTIRLNERDREILEIAANERGLGLSGFVRSLAEAEARSLRDAAVRAEGERMLERIKANPATLSEFEELSSGPIDAFGELPHENWKGSWGL